MRTVVVFYLSQPGALKVCELDDVSDGRKPLRGEHWTFNGARYQVVDTDESLGITTQDGRVRSGNEKLLELLSVVGLDEQTVAMLLMSMEYIGSRPAQKPKGLVVPGSSNVDDFDNVVLVTTKLVRKPNGPLFTDVLSAAQGFTAGRERSTMTALLSSAGATSLRIQEDASE